MAFAADWLEIPLEESDYKIYIDRDTTVANKPVVEYWLKLEYGSLQKIPESQMKFDKVLSHYLIICDHNVETVNKEKYFRDGVMVKSRNHPEAELSWKPVEVDSTNSLLKNRLCPENEPAVDNKKK